MMQFLTLMYHFLKPALIYSNDRLNAKTFVLCGIAVRACLTVQSLTASLI